MSLKIFNYFNLYPSCIVVKGYNKSVLMDLDENDFSFLPNLIADFITEFKASSISKIKERYSNDLQNEVADLVSKFLKAGYGILSVKKESFLPITQNYFIPYHFTSLIVQLPVFYNINETANIFQNLVVENLIVEVNNYNTEVLNDIKYLSRLVRHNTLKIVSSTNIDQENSIRINDSVLRTAEIYHVLDGSTQNTKHENLELIYLNSFKIKSTSDFYSNIRLYTESLKYNSNFYKKICILNTGIIKNGFTSHHSFGYINKLEKKSFLKLVSSSKFRELEMVSKDRLDICKHCEFRYMCVDSRVPIKRNSHEWYFETECNYNPYIAKWQHEVGYKTLSECGIQSNKNGFKLNRKKLNTINKEL